MPHFTSANCTRSCYFPQYICRSFSTVL